MAFLLLLLLIYISSAREQFDLPGLLIIGLASLRLLPSINRMLLALQALKFSAPLLTQISPLIESFEKYELSRFEKDTTIRNMLSIRQLYHKFDNNIIFENLNFEVKKGEKVLIAGKSGKGKTTLVDIVAGIRKPISGYISVSTKKIQYLTQDTFIPDGNYKSVVSDNSEFEPIKFLMCLAKAEVNWLIPSQLLDDETLIADGASNLSGGQRQRIALARALYQEPELYILDEAASGVDEETEIRIFKTLMCSDATIICVTHSQHIQKLFTQRLEL